MVVAPATADSIARFAGGLADDLLAAVVLATRAPLLLAPAMNVNMWENPLTQANLARLLEQGRVTTVGPDAGELACGWIGAGRLVEPTEIVAAAGALLARPRSLAGRRVVITAGPTLRADRRRAVPGQPLVGEDGVRPGGGGGAAGGRGDAHRRSGARWRRRWGWAGASTSSRRATCSRRWAPWRPTPTWW